VNENFQKIMNSVMSQGSSLKIDKKLLLLYNNVNDKEGKMVNPIQSNPIQSNPIQSNGLLVNEKLRNHFKENIAPIYEIADEKHPMGKDGNGMSHIRDAMACAITNVNYINKSIRSEAEKVDIDVVYAIIGYHDTGYHMNSDTDEQAAYNLKNHARLSAEKVYADYDLLREFFTDEQIDLIASTIAKHDTPFRKFDQEYPNNPVPNIYDMIMHASDVKYDLDIELAKSYKYTLITKPDLGIEQIAEDMRKYLLKEYSPIDEVRQKRFIKNDILLPNTTYNDYCDDVFELASNSEQFRQRLQVIDENSIISEKDLSAIEEFTSQH